MEALLRSWFEARPSTSDPVALLRGFVDFHIRYHTFRQKDVFIANMELRSLPPKQYDIVAGFRARYEAELKSILLSGVEKEIFQIEDLDVATFAIIAMLTGVCTWFREDGRLSREELVACYIELVFRGVGVPHRQSAQENGRKRTVRLPKRIRS
jgi:hypothetical protein